ncbi:hypothetical protein FOL47_010111 [Perkinsus chesapeaki]|uniref:ATP-dependent RNA helicase n=1 Tax=Perkinsus chesapeaki TaxID=330153 RepID=A0A7J6L4P5_PERCH|nr:hypothetical protein FOL47_010111 [Perkinsus chesapeaki]
MLAPTKKERVAESSPAAKKRRVSAEVINGDIEEEEEAQVSTDVCELDVLEVIRFYFNGSQEGIPPAYAHQSFDEAESFVWLKTLTPLVIRVDVDTRDFSVGIAFEHPKLPNDKLMKTAYKRHCDTLLARMHTARFSPLSLKPFYGGCKAFRLGPNGNDNCLLKKLKDDLLQIEDPAIPSPLALVTIPESLYDFWRRIEWLMLWFIDASGTIDLPTSDNQEGGEDIGAGRWTLYLLRDTTTQQIKSCASVYKFPALVADGKRRLRVAQFLTVPTQQKKGYGGMIYRHIATAAISATDVDEITFEDPSPGMQGLREVVTLSLCYKAFPEALPEDTRRDPPTIADKLKIPLSFARRISELEWFAANHYPAACAPSVEHLSRKESKALAAERLAYKQRQRKYCTPDDPDFPDNFIELESGQQKALVKDILQGSPPYRAHYTDLIMHLATWRGLLVRTAVRRQAALGVRCMSTTERSINTRKFTELNLSSATLKGISEVMKLDALTATQMRSLPKLMGDDDCDVLIKARTGTGKTLTFLLPIVESIVNMPNWKSHGGVLALVLCPTRELGLQTCTELDRLLAHHDRDLSAVALVGGVPRRHDLEMLRKRRPKIIVGTPGRVGDHIEATFMFHTLFEKLQWLVLDEADRLLELSFADTLDVVDSVLPNSRRTVLCSATIPEVLLGKAQTWCHRGMLPLSYAFVDCIGDAEASHAPGNSTLTEDTLPPADQGAVAVTPESMNDKQFYVTCPADKIVTALHNILQEELTRSPYGYKIMVFFPTARMTAFFSTLFNRQFRMPVIEMHKKKGQTERTLASAQFQTSESAIMFTSDVSSRGMDYSNVSSVIQVMAPSHVDSYVHRVGRTARAGKEGTAVLLLPEEESSFVSELLRHTIPLQPLPRAQLDPQWLLNTNDLTAAALSGGWASSNASMLHQAETMYASLLAHLKSSRSKLRNSQIISIASGILRSCGMSSVPGIPEDLAQKLGMQGEPELRIFRGFDSFGESDDVSHVERPLLKSEIKANEIDQACGKSGHFNHKKIGIDDLYEVIRLAETPLEYGTCMITLNRFYNLGVDLRDPVLTTKLLACAIKLKRKDQAIELAKSWQKWLRHPPNPKLLHALMVGLNAIGDAYGTREVVSAIRSNWAMDLTSIPYEMAIEAFSLSGQSDELALIWADAVDTMGMVLPWQSHVNIMTCALSKGDIELAKEVLAKGISHIGLRPPARFLAAQAWLEFALGNEDWLFLADKAMREARRIGSLDNQPVFHPGFVEALFEAGSKGDDKATKFRVKAEAVLGRFYTGTGLGL